LKRIISLFLVSFFVFTLGACNPDNADALREVRVNEVTHSVFYAPFYAAMELGYFEEEGLTITLTNGGGSDKSMTALLTGDADVGLMGPETAVYVANEGREDYAVIFAQLTQFPAIHKNRALSRLLQIVHAAHQGAFSGTAHTDDTVNLSGINGETYILQRRNLAGFTGKGLRQISYFNHTYIILILNLPEPAAHPTVSAYPAEPLPGCRFLSQRLRRPFACCV